MNIYQWLPFTEPELARAAAVTTQVTTDYNTFTYTESAASYVARMNGLITSQLSQTLKNGFSTLGVAQTRTSQKQVSSGTRHDRARSAPSARPASRSWSPRPRSSPGRRARQTSSAQYAVTVSGQGSSWQVYDIEPAAAGNN